MLAKPITKKVPVTVKRLVHIVKDTEPSSTLSTTSHHKSSFLCRVPEAQ